jgi:hypothetical protein
VPARYAPIRAAYWTGTNPLESGPSHCATRRGLSSLLKFESTAKHIKRLYKFKRVGFEAI